MKFKLFNNLTVETLKDEYLEQAEEAIKDYPDIFTDKEKRLYRQDFLEFLMNPSNASKLRVLIMKLDDHVIGVVMFRAMEDSSSYFKVDLLVIHRDFQGKGYGKKLLKESFRRIKSLGGKYIYLLTSNEEYNKPTLGFYKKVGFERVGVFPDYYSDPYTKEIEDCSIFMKTV